MRASACRGARASGAGSPVPGAAGRRVAVSRNRRDAGYLAGIRVDVAGAVACEDRASRGGVKLHLTDHELILDLDCELASREAKRVAAHLAECWTCRARRQEL